MTAKDVARLAGVSRSTVSYVINETPSQTISAPTRKRVLAAIEELGYAPSAAARELRTGRSSTVLIVLPDALIGSSIAQLIEEVSDGLEPYGYSVVYRRNRKASTLERAWREIMPAAVVNLVAFDAAQEAVIAEAGIPVVSSYVDATGPCVVPVPELAIGRLQAAHLLERGHRRLAYAAPIDPRVETFYTPRLAGAREVLAAANLPGPVVVPTPPADAAAAAAAFAPYLTEGAQDRVTAVCAYNDEQAFVLLAAMRVLGRSVPDDLAMVGVDNVPLAPFAFPPLTSVDIGVAATASQLSTTILTAVRGEPCAEVLPRPPTLVRRQST